MPIPIDAKKLLYTAPTIATSPERSDTTNDRGSGPYYERSKKLFVSYLNSIVL